MKAAAAAIIFLLMASTLSATKPPAGTYRGVLSPIQGTEMELPFIFELSYRFRKPVIVIHNADEKIKVESIQIKGDSLNFRMPVFDTEFKTRITTDGLEGVWINHYRKNDNTIPFKATFGENSRFKTVTLDPGNKIEGRWECNFDEGGGKMMKAVGLFHHIEQTAHISGTFITETGDYRYLEGVLDGDTLRLSTFDGSHAYLFTAVFRNDTLTDGMFYSGSHWQQSWTGFRNDSVALRSPDEITIVVDKSKPVRFTFKNTSGRKISLSDRRYANNPVIIQVMGSWCPNCMDESRFLAELYEQYKKSGLEIIALAFEKTSDEKKTRRQIDWMRKRLNIKYEVLITGATGKEEASKALPALNSISAFPTTLFLDRNHNVVKILTGFNGPATGKEYENFKMMTETLIQNLLK